jgi:ATP-binding cassette subfamily C protein LapB
VNGTLTIGGLAATTILTGRLLQPVLKGLGLWSRYPFIRLAEEKMRRMEDLTPPMVGEIAFPSSKSGALRLENVSFRYPGATRNAVDGVCLDVPARSYIGIVGETSSGRSTLLKLMNGLLTPQAGRVRFDDVPLSALVPQEVRRRIALLPTSPTIYTGTLLENLTLFEDGPAKRRALALCRVLGLADYVGGLSRGLDTPLGGSSDTPMGVAQRISIIRSLAQDPKIVLFDTANAALDHEADRLLLAFFERQKGKRAAVFVTDRPSYLRLCDTVFEMVDGRLRRRGMETTAPGERAS